MGEMRRAIAREEQERRTQDLFASTLVIAPSTRPPKHKEVKNCKLRASQRQTGSCTILGKGRVGDKPLATTNLER
jgi:hypothetical protein